MKFKAINILIVCLMLVYSCKSKQIATQNVVATENDNVTRIEEAPIREEISTTDVTVRTESVTPVDRADTQTMYGFYVIIGSFREIANARQYNTDLIAKGFSPVILASENGLFRVSVGGYNQEGDARRQIADIRARFAEHRDVWLLVRR